MTERLSAGVAYDMFGLAWDARNKPKKRNDTAEFLRTRGIKSELDRWGTGICSSYMAFVFRRLELCMSWFRSASFSVSSRHFA